MATRASSIAMAVCALVAVSGCASSVNTGKALPAPGGTVGFAVSETCKDSKASNCISVADQMIVLPLEFELAGVQGATAAPDRESGAIDLTFTEEGATVLHRLSGEAATAGQSARLLIRAGDEILAAVTVMDAFRGDSVRFAFGAERDAQEIIDLIHEAAN